MTTETTKSAPPVKNIDQPDLPPLDTAAVWSDVAAWLPWQLWLGYGDAAVLAESYESMTTHARRELELLSERDVWDTSFQFGDWLDPDAPDDQPWAAKADPGVVATACAFRTCVIAADTAALLGRAEDEAEFRLGAERIRSGFHAAYVGNERIHSDCTAVYTLALVFGLLDESQRGWAGRRLAELVEAGGFHISTGFAATPFITEALSSTGHLDHAYRLLLQTECPSWLYPVTMGATTIWERWDSMLPDGSINPGEMTSFNHYALGAVADWMHRVMGGLSALEPGYRRILFAPQPGGGVSWAEAALQTPHGRASIRWDRSGDALDLRVEVPEGTTAVVRLPGAADRDLPAGEHRLSVLLPSSTSLERTA